MVKLDVVSSIYGGLWEETGWRCTYNLPLTGIYKGIFLRRFWRMLDYIYIYI